MQRWIRGCPLVFGSATFLFTFLDSSLFEALCVTPIALAFGVLCGVVVGAIAERVGETGWGKRLFSVPAWLKFTLSAVGILLLGVLWYVQPWDPIGPLGYHRIDLGMTEVDIVAILGNPSEQYRRSRHIGGITSPGVVTVLYSGFGLPFEDLPKRYGEKTRTGRSVTLRQWWGNKYTIDVAFDDDGAAAGVYLMRFRIVNWY